MRRLMLKVFLPGWRALDLALRVRRKLQAARIARRVAEAGFHRLSEDLRNAYCQGTGNGPAVELLPFPEPPVPGATVCYASVVNVRLLLRVNGTAVGVTLHSPERSAVAAILERVLHAPRIATTVENVKGAPTP